MLFYCVVISAVYLSFSASVPCFLSAYCVVPRLLSQLDTAQIGRKTPTKGSYSSLCVVITRKQYISCPQGCYPFGWNIPCI